MARHEHAPRMRATIAGLVLIGAACGDPTATESTRQIMPDATAVSFQTAPTFNTSLAATIPAIEQSFAPQSAQTEAIAPEESEAYLAEARKLQATYPLFSHSADADYVPLILPMPLVRYNDVNYVATDAQNIYNYERLLYWNRAQESGFDPLQIDGGGNDFDHSYHGAVSPMGAEGAAQFLPTKWSSTVDAIVNEGRADALGYFNWRDVPQLANLGAYINTSPNNVPADMQDFVYRVEFTLTPTQWDPTRWALQDGNPVATNFINPANAQ